MGASANGELLACIRWSESGISCEVDLAAFGVESVGIAPDAHHDAADQSVPRGPVIQLRGSEVSLAFQLLAAAES